MAIGTTFLKNAWAMAAWSNEIGEVPLRRRLLGEPVVLFRKADRTVAALVDRCPHRQAPLSMGVREGDRLVCPYHGLTFDSSGACVRNPFADTIPKGATVRSFSIAERDGIVWLWPGDPDRASLEQIPDFSDLHHGVFGAPLTGYLPMRAPYEMGTDNLMDLSHIEFVHKGSFAGRGVIFAGKHSLRQEGNRLHSNWWMPDVPAPGHTMGIYDPAMRCDHWLDMRWDPPSIMHLTIGACPTGGDRAGGVIVRQAHILTPETETTTHYFWASSRTMPQSAEGDAFVRGLLEQAFADEDKPLIEATAANMDGADFWDFKPVFLGIDAGGTTARRLLQALIAGEAT